MINVSNPIQVTPESTDVVSFHRMISPLVNMCSIKQSPARCYCSVQVMTLKLASHCQFCRAPQCWTPDNDRHMAHVVHIVLFITQSTVEL